MNRLFAIALVACVACASASASAPSFEDFLAEHGKSYSTTAELGMRKSLFEEQVAIVNQHNQAGKYSWTMTINHFSDWTPAEKQAINGYDRALAFSLKTDDSRQSISRVQPDSSLPSSMDWRNARPEVVTPVKNQGNCGSCWTFGSAETIESHYALKYPGKLQSLSEQQIASCPFDTNPLDCGGSGGCEGGIPELAFESVMKAGGIASEWLYPYRSISGKDFTCSSLLGLMNVKQVNLTSYTKLPSNSYSAVMEALVNEGPLAINVDASTWHGYHGGVYSGCNQTAPALDHVVQLVGFGTDAMTSQDYWLVRNSWSPFWGENGYIRLARLGTNFQCGTDHVPQDGTGCKGGPSTQHVCGTCGILFDVSYPIIG